MKLKEALWLVGITGSMLAVGDSGIVGLLNERAQRNDEYGQHVVLVDKSVSLGHGSSGMMTGTNAQDFLRSVGIDYKIKEGEMGVTLRPHLHNKNIEVNVVKNNPYSKVYVGFENYIGQVDNSTLINSWINKKRQISEAK